MFGKSSTDITPVEGEPQSLPLKLTKQTRTVEQHAKISGVDPVHFAAARAYNQWAVGAEMSEEDFDAAIEKTLAEPHGYGVAVPNQEGR